MREKNTTQTLLKRETQMIINLSFFKRRKNFTNNLMMFCLKVFIIMTIFSKIRKCESQSLKYIKCFQFGNVRPKGDFNLQLANGTETQRRILFVSVFVMNFYQMYGDTHKHAHNLFVFLASKQFTEMLLGPNIFLKKERNSFCG